MINYESLKSSTAELRQIFIDFFEHVLMMEEILLKQLKKSPSLDSKFYEKIWEFKLKSNNFNAQILDEGCWIISKDSPRANQLRFIISVINSGRDLKRMSDHVLSIAKFFHSTPEANKEFCKILILTLDECAKLTKNYFELIRDRNEDNYYQVALNLYKDYISMKEKQTEKLFKFIHTIEKTKINNWISKYYSTFKYIDRNVDHCLNIVENFVYVRENDFFLTKQTRRITKKEQNVKN